MSARLLQQFGRRKKVGGVEVAVGRDLEEELVKVRGNLCRLRSDLRSLSMVSLVPERPLNAFVPGISRHL